MGATSTLTITAPVPEECLTSLWYSKEEQDRQRRALKKDVRRVMRRLAMTPMASITQDELHECVGMEMFLSQDLLLETRRQKIRHVRTILAAQEWQHASNVQDGEELSCLSRESSDGNCARASCIAAGYWQVLK